ncbi:hypothetical protein [Acaryochloris sp. CCMEE 5410]|uniref:hypothetical protein n=1 Tax=Acaryochloris sp. CCMEE 5410 TaxID=310037 RepID=UPI0021D3A2E9|nr:hypothetical protein [Acaryochloris sp. CCMEE 5410]KAI9129030.1 hypothetical protein ON05_037035 [Acaryochloris sp. CCMEE 5410]
MIFDHLRQFRQTLYSCFGASKDALFELMDAVLMSLHILTNFSTPVEVDFSGRMAVTSPPLWKLSSPVKWQ